MSPSPSLAVTERLALPPGLTWPALVLTWLITGQLLNETLTLAGPWP